MNYDQESEKQFNHEKIKTRNIGPELEKKLIKIYPPNSHIEEKFKNFDINIVTNENGEAITFYLGKRRENGKIAGDVYYRKIKKRENNLIVESHWDNHGKVSGT